MTPPPPPPKPERDNSFIAEISALAAGITPGYSDKWDYYSDGRAVTTGKIPFGPFDGPYLAVGVKPEDGRFIIGVRNIFPEVAAALQALDLIYEATIETEDPGELRHLVLKNAGRTLAALKEAWERSKR